MMQKMNPQAIAGARRWACHGARLFDGEAVHEDHAVLIEDGRIVAELPMAQAPRDVPLLSMPDCTLLPGLIDVHAHFMRWEGPLYLAGGVTTVRDVGNAAAWILARREEAAQRSWPRLFTTGPAIDGAPPHWPEISQGSADCAEACRHVRTLAAAGVDGIKLYVRLPEAWIADVARTAHEVGLPVLMHCGSQRLLTVARAGVDECFHLDGLLGDIWPDCPVTGWMEGWGHAAFSDTWERQQQVADEIARLGLIITPTMTVWDFFLDASRGEQPATADRPYLPRQLLAWLARAATPAQADYWARILPSLHRFLGLLIARGVCVLPGTDVPWTLRQPGHLLWRELGHLVNAGMPTLAALRAATADAARALRVENLGRLAPGCLADLVCVEGDPTATIPERPVITTVVKAGRVYVVSELLAQADPADTTLVEEPMGQAFQRVYGERGTG